MSSILLSNPFISPVAPSTSAQQTPVTALAVAPMRNMSSGSGAGNATSFSGSGFSGGSDQQNSAALMRDRAKAVMARPSNATSTSVVNAQTQVDVQITPFGANLPRVNMPDPLPTSPLLLAMSVRA